MNLTKSDTNVRISISGPVRLSDAARLRSLCIEAFDEALDVEIDLAAAEHLHLTALQCLRALERQLVGTGRSFSLGSASDAAATAIRLGGLSSWLRTPEEVR